MCDKDPSCIQHSCGLTWCQVYIITYSVLLLVLQGLFSKFTAKQHKCCCCDNASISNTT